MLLIEGVKLGEILPFRAESEYNGTMVSKLSLELKGKLKAHLIQGRQVDFVSRVDPCQLPGDLVEKNPAAALGTVGTQWEGMPRWISNVCHEFRVRRTVIYFPPQILYGNRLTGFR